MKRQTKLLEPICSWCGQPACCMTGYIVFDDLTETYALSCSKQEPVKKHMANPLFQSRIAFNKWRKAHPLKSSGIKYVQAIFKLKVNDC